MQIPNFTDLLLTNSAWFLAGIIVYIFLVLRKVFLLAYLQPQVITGNISAKKPFRQGRPLFYRTLLKRSLYLSAFSYIFRYREKDWPEIENEPIKRRLELLRGVSEFLTPYLIISFLFVVLRIWIEMKLFYHALSITLGQIQENLFFISRLRFVNFILEHKNILFVIYGLLVIFIFAEATKEKKAKAAKKIFSQVLICFSLLLNVSFFSMGIASTLAGKQKEMTALGIEIIKSHNKIFVTACVDVAEKEVDDYLKQQEDIAQDSRDYLKKEEEKSKLDSSVLFQFTQALETRIGEISTEYSNLGYPDNEYPGPDEAYVYDKNLRYDPEEENKDIQFAVPGESRPGAADNEGGDIPKESPAQAVVRVYEKIDAGAKKGDEIAPYILREKDWNLEGARVMQKNLETFEAAEAAAKPVSPGKARKVLELLCAYGLDATLDQFCELVHIEPQPLFKKLAGLVLETNLKECIVGHAVKLLNGLKKGVRSVFSARPECGGAAEDIQEKERLRRENEQYVRDKEQSAKETLANDAIARNEEKKRELILEGEEKEFGDQNASLRKEIAEAIEEKPYGAASNSGRRLLEYEQLSGDKKVAEYIRLIELQNMGRGRSTQDALQDALDNACRSQQNETERNLFRYLTPDDVEGAKAIHARLEYNLALVRSKSNVSDVVSAVGKGVSVGQWKRLFPQICPRCGLPYTFPICLAGVGL